MDVGTLGNIDQGAFQLVIHYLAGVKNPTPSLYIFLGVGKSPQSREQVARLGALSLYIPRCAIPGARQSIRAQKILKGKFLLLEIISFINENFSKRFLLSGGYRVEPLPALYSLFL